MRVQTLLASLPDRNPSECTNASSTAPSSGRRRRLPITPITSGSRNACAPPGFRVTLNQQPFIYPTCIQNLRVSRLLTPFRPGVVRAKGLIALPMNTRLSGGLGPGPRAEEIGGDLRRHLQQLFLLTPSQSQPQLYLPPSVDTDGPAPDLPPGSMAFLHDGSQQICAAVSRRIRRSSHADLQVGNR
ncbi:unnamed protein product [Protopolystoma xenopodis]|uniref:Uncharacterized protein n=1 Tax=Protopolystoma xenopodis TaxID=117903 RepID=A0A3S5A376_9PLAT|nr:unnamed protein product [Protopolystoma xenopodis]